MSDENNFEVFIDDATGAAVISEISPEEFNGEFFRSVLDPRHYRALASWAEQIHPSPRRDRSLFHRDKYVTPGRILEQMAVAYDALDDDLVGNVADMSEALAFQKVSFECGDKKQESVWSQIGRDLDLDGWIRTAWRELFTVSQFYGVKWWGLKTYKSKVKAEKRASRKEFTMFVPLRLGFLDPTRVIPVSNDVFGRSELAWIADEADMELLDRLDQEGDGFLQALWVGKYQPSEKEKKDLSAQGIPTDRLVTLNPDYVFKHTLTKSPYERWSKVRMKGIFPLLDLKHQLREMDRAFLLGGINFLVLVTRGSDQKPATRGEVESTATQVRTQSKMPIIVSDHRISVEIITPNLDAVLDKDKWAVLDERVMMRLWGTFQLPSQTSSRETSMTLGRVIARGIGSRRHMIKRTLERELIRATVEHPLNADLGLEEDVSLEFAPRRMELEMDAALINVLQELRDRGDLSRETVLNELNFDQSLEARRREVEKEEYDEVFTPVNVPFDSPNRVTPGGSGRQGGRPSGEGGNNNGGQGGQEGQ